jgi:hypothetical protein
VGLRGDKIFPGGQWARQQGRVVPDPPSIESSPVGLLSLVSLGKFFPRRSAESFGIFFPPNQGHLTPRTSPGQWIAMVIQSE